MKKSIVLTLLVCLAVPAFADDAMVLPAGVFRFTLVPSYDFVPGAYGTNGSYTGYNAGQGKVTAFNGAAALEYGVNDWITAAVQWTPGWNMSSSVDTNWSTVPVGPRTSNANVNGLYDLFIGAKIQLVGEKAPIKSESIRFCPALGITVPFGGVNFADQWTNYANGNNVTVANVDIQTLGVGARIYADYIFSRAFFLNLYSQFLYFPGTVAFKDASFQDYATYFLTSGPNPSVGYGYELTVELEPHYIYSLSDGVQLQGSLPFTYTYSPDLTIGGSDAPSTSQSLIVMRPTLDLFLLKSAIPFPLEFKLAYSLPLVGWDAGATNALIFIIRVYFKV